MTDRLAWDGYAWTRHASGVSRSLLTNEPVEAVPIGPGWTVFSASQIHAEDAPTDEVLREAVLRSGLCVEVRPDEDGQPVYRCVELWRNEVHVLDVPADDVKEARPADRGSVARHRKALFGALGGQVRHRAGRAWMENAVLVLGAFDG